MKSTSALIIRKALCCLFFTLLMVTVLFAGYIACVIKTSAGNASRYYYLGVFSGCFPWIILIAFSCLNVFLLIAINKTTNVFIGLQSIINVLRTLVIAFSNVSGYIKTLKEGYSNALPFFCKDSYNLSENMCKCGFYLCPTCI